MSAAEDVLLRPALEVALAVARAGEEADPVDPAPPPLRPFLRFTHRIPPHVLGPARRVLEDDESFRRRVAEAASEAVVGRAGWLFLARPDGWERELAQLVREAEAAVTAAGEAREERTARRRLPKLEEALRRSEAEAASAREEARQAAARLSDERRARRDSEQAAAELRAKVAAAEASRDAMRAALDEATARVRLLDERVNRVERRLEAATAELEEARAQAAAVDRAGAAAAPGDRVGEVDRAALAEAVRDAGAAAARMSAALADVARHIAGPPPLVSAPPEGSAGLDVATPAPSAGGGRRRTPLVLPPAVFDDSDEAAEYLVRHPGVVLVVDGYNASHALWGDLKPLEQRRRLVDALAELSARTGADVEVVFDGAEGAGPPTVRSAGRHPVRVRFSAPDVEADDVVIERAAELPPGRPVLVASSDHRVRDGARRHGANVISSGQLAALLRSRH